MMKLFSSILLVLSLNGCAAVPFGGDVYSSQLPATKTQVPESKQKLASAMPKFGLGEMKPLIDDFSMQGKLLASWTPSTNVKSSVTFVIIHGGMGIGGSDIKNAVALKNQHNANILILDSFWSRGREVNGGRYDGRLGRRLTFDDRILDLSAAGKFLASQGVDASKTFIIGGSQGGGTVMRAFTQDPEIEKLIKPYYRGGISLYPACSDMSPTMQLGPYFAKVIIISGGRDYGNPISECPTVSVKSAARWLHWPEATHGFDLDTHGVWKPSVDGDCSKKNFAKNQYIEMCYSEKRTQEMYQEVQRFVQ